MSKVIIRVSFGKGSNLINAGITAKGNVTLTGCIEYTSNNLDVSYQQSYVELNSKVAIGIVSTLVMPNNKETETLIQNINNIQARRVAGRSANKFPFVWLCAEIKDELIIYNRRTNSTEEDRLAFVNVQASSIYIRNETPIEVLQLINQEGSSTIQGIKPALTPITARRSYYSYVAASSTRRVAA